MVRQQHVEGDFRPTAYMDCFLRDTCSGRRRAPDSLARVTSGEQAMQPGLEAGFVVTLPFHKDAMHFRRAARVEPHGWSEGRDKEHG